MKGHVVRGSRLTALALAALAAAAVGGVASVGAAPARSGGEEVVIGALLDLGSGWTSLGRASRVTLQLAVTDANARLKKTGSMTRVRLRIVDVRGDPGVV